MAKPKSLRYTGKNDPNGYYFAGVPARDLDEADIALLDDDTLKNMTGGDKPLYVERGAKSETPKADAKRHEAKAEAKAESKPAEPPVVAVAEM